MREKSVLGITFPTKLVIVAPAEKQVAGVTYTEVLKI